MVRNPWVLLLGGVILLLGLYQTRMRGPVVYVVALAIYGLILVNFSTIQDQLKGALHPDKKAGK